MIRIEFITEEPTKALESVNKLLSAGHKINSFRLEHRKDEDNYYCRIAVDKKGAVKFSEMVGITWSDDALLRIINQ